MASTFTTSLRLELQGLGEHRASWGTNANMVFSMIEDAIAGRSEVTVPDLATPYPLSTANSLPDEARRMLVRFNGALTADRTVTIPNVNKTYVMNNATTGGKSVI